MAVKPDKSKSRKGQQIEPLDWSAMAQSPAFRGMVSFLEVTPEDIQRQRTAVSDSRTGGEAHTGNDSHTGSDTHIGGPSKLPLRDSAGTELLSQRQSAAVGESRTGSDAHTGSVSRTGIQSGPIHRIEHSLSDPGTGVDRATPDTARPELDSITVQPISANAGMSENPLHRNDSHTLSETHTGSATLTGSDAHTGSDPHAGAQMNQHEGLLPSDRHGQQGTYEASSDTPTGGDSLIGEQRTRPSKILEGRYDQQRFGHVPPQHEESNGRQPASDTRTGSRSSVLVSSDSYARTTRRMPMIQGEVVWQNRRIRKCVLAQDAHSQGEDALFSAMWNTAKPDPADPSGSRMVRIGYAELAQKSRMHRSNVRINIAGLRAKLAIEVLDEHDSRDVTPRTYRLYSFKEILERRRAAGLEYVIRKKSVVFVTETGQIVPLPGLPKASVRKPRNPDSNGSAEGFRSTRQEADPEQMDLDVRQISDALSQHWAVDEAAAHQLLRQCRSVRRDAEIDEIIFFIKRETPDRAVE